MIRQDLYEWCEESKLTYKEISKALDIQQCTLSNLFRSPEKISIELADKIVTLTNNKLSYTYLCPSIFSLYRIEKIISHLEQGKQMQTQEQYLANGKKESTKRASMEARPKRKSQGKATRNVSRKPQEK